MYRELFANKVLKTRSRRLTFTFWQWEGENKNDSSEAPDEELLAIKQRSGTAFNG
jgi:hypothetical protein